MRGLNTLFLNIETVTDALQAHFDRVFMAPVDVTKVEHAMEAGHDFLVVEIRDRPRPMPEAAPLVVADPYDRVAHDIAAALRTPTPHTPDMAEMLERVGIAEADAAPVARVPMRDRIAITVMTPFTVFLIAGLANWRFS